MFCRVVEEVWVFRLLLFKEYWIWLRCWRDTRKNFGPCRERWQHWKVGTHQIIKIKQNTERTYCMGFLACYFSELHARCGLINCRSPTSQCCQHWRHVPVFLKRSFLSSRKRDYYYRRETERLPKKTPYSVFRSATALIHELQCLACAAHSFLLQILAALALPSS